MTDKISVGVISHLKYIIDASEVFMEESDVHVHTRITLFCHGHLLGGNMASEQ